MIPIAFTNGQKPGQQPGQQPRQKRVSILAADIGGTKTNIALYEADGANLQPTREQRYVSADHATLMDIIHDFCGNTLPDRIAAAVAGPVIGGKSKLTNLPWVLDSSAMSRDLNIPVCFINDLEATAYGLAGLDDSQRTTISAGDKNAKGNIAILAPGTGLGEAGLYWDGQFYHPFATEGGHSDFAPRTKLDVEMFYHLQKEFGHVSWERVVSGMGIKNIFHFLTDVCKEQIPEWLAEKLKDGDPAAVISQSALHHEDLVCAETMELFVRYMATEASSLVLKLMATGGLYLAGGIPPKILPLLQSDNWTRNFDNDGRMHDLSDRIPVHVVLNDKMALQGAAFYGAYNM